jgi:hypothetical protein
MRMAESRPLEWIDEQIASAEYCSASLNIERGTTARLFSVAHDLTPNVVQKISGTRITLRPGRWRGFLGADLRPCGSSGIRIPACAFCIVPVTATVHTIGASSNRKTVSTRHLCATAAADCRRAFGDTRRESQFAQSV